MRILIVEDERALCDAIARSLRNLAYSVDCCHDGQEALDLLGVEVFDLVVLDLNSFSNATRVHISSLRKKLRSALGYDPIRNRIGEGYVMEDSE